MTDHSNPTARDSPQGLCAVCGGRIEYLDPTGDGLAAWWGHEFYPDNDHPATPKDAV